MYAIRSLLQKYPKRTVYNFTCSEFAWKKKLVKKKKKTFYIVNEALNKKIFFKK